MSEISEKTIVAHEQTLNAMANVNAVDGFDPCLVTACYRDEEGKSRMYLQAEPAMLWFRLKHPNGRLEQVLTRANDQMATVEGRVIDSNGNLLANAFATRYRSDDNKFGKDYIQNAGTAAIRKALGNCGFGTPANAEYIEGITPLFTVVDDEDTPVDSGVPTRIPVPPIPKEYQNQTPVMVEDMDEYSAGSLLTKKIHTIKSFMHLVVKDLTQEEEQLIDTCLIMVYKKFGITNDNNSIYDRETGQYKKMPLLQDLHKEMLKYPELHRISNILNPLITGSMACYNRPTNVDLKAKYIVFDFNGMKGAILTMSMFVVLDFVWTKIKEDRKKRKAVFIDECWKLIGTDSNEMAAEDVVEIFRTIRAYGGSAFAMTQDISQFYEYKGGKYGKAIIGNADTKIIMHLIPSEAQALQAAIQLTDAEMENVSSLQRGQGLVCSSSAKLFVDFVAADYEKQEITTDAKSFYMQEKALKEKQHQEEQARLEVEDKKEPAKTDDNSEKR